MQASRSVILGLTLVLVFTMWLQISQAQGLQLPQLPVFTRYGAVAPPGTFEILVFEIPSGRITGRVPVKVALTPDVHIAFVDGPYAVVAPPGTFEVLIFAVPSGQITGRVPVRVSLTPNIRIGTGRMDSGWFGIIAAPGTNEILIFRIPSGDVVARVPVSVGLPRSKEDPLTSSVVFPVITNGDRYALVAPPGTFEILIIETVTGKVAGKVPVPVALKPDVYITLTDRGNELLGLVAPPETFEVLIFDIPSGVIRGRVRVGVALKPRVFISVSLPTTGAR